ncbi:hypothetical protein Tco_0183519 [Tanacetum coccineum]
MLLTPTLAPRHEEISNFTCTNCCRLVPSCFVIFDLKPLSLSFDFVFSSEIFKSLSFRLDRLCQPCELCPLTNILILCIILKVSYNSHDRLDILEGDLVYQVCAEVFLSSEHRGRFNLRRISLTGFQLKRRLLSSDYVVNSFTGPLIDIQLDTSLILIETPQVTYCSAVDDDTGRISMKRIFKKRIKKKAKKKQNQARNEKDKVLSHPSEENTT